MKKIVAVKWKLLAAVFIFAALTAVCLRSGGALAAEKRSRNELARTGYAARKPADNDPSKANHAAELLNLINAARRKSGASDLKLDEAMGRAANRRASEIKTKYSHERPDGRSFHTVFAEFGFPMRAGAENIGWRSGPSSTDLEAFNKAFMESPGHRKNMLNPEYSSVGLGFSNDGDKFYVAELFADGS